MLGTILACLLAGAFSGSIGYVINSHYWRKNLWSQWELKNPRISLLVVFSGAIIGAIAVSLTGNVFGLNIALPLLASLVCGSAAGYAALLKWGN